METIRFEDLELDAKIMRAITDMGFEAASPIQGQAIPLELQGLDIIGQAQTGTGKTAAFGVSKSTIHKDVTERLLQINPSLAGEARKVLDLNKSERHIRGGLATREKYLHQHA